MYFLMNGPARSLESGQKVNIPSTTIVSYLTVNKLIVNGSLC